MTLHAYLLAGGPDDGDEFHRLLAQVTPDQWLDLLGLATDPRPATRRALIVTLPLLEADPPPGDWIDTATVLTTDPDPTVRDWACCALAEAWPTVDTPLVREALTDRLDDPHRDTRCEALLGLARRRDPRALPRVRAALSRPWGEVWRLELVAAGVLGDPSLHPLVLRHLDGWDDADRRTVEAVARLTDPAGPGDRLFIRVAGLYAARAEGRRPDRADLAAWRLLLEMIDYAPDRAPEFFAATEARLGDDPARLHHLRTESAFASLVSPSERHEG